MNRFTRRWGYGAIVLCCTFIAGAAGAATIDTAQRAVVADVNRGFGHDEDTSAATGTFNETASVASFDLTAAAAQNTALGLAGQVISASGTGSADAARPDSIGASFAHLGRSLVDVVFTVSGNAAWTLSGNLNITGQFSGGNVLFEQVGGASLLTANASGAFAGGGNLVAGNQYHLRIVSEVNKPQTFDPFSGHSDFAFQFSVTDIAAPGGGGGGAAVPLPPAIWAGLIGAAMVARRVRSRA